MNSKRASVGDRLMSVAAALAIPVMLLALWRGTGDLRAKWSDHRAGKLRSVVVDSATRNYMSDAVLGDSAAEVTVFEFMDYECPGCRSAHPTVKTLLEKHGNARVVIMHFPLETIHANAMMAAALSICAEQQGAFDRAHDYLIRQKDLADTSAALGFFVDSLGIDARTLRECVGDDATSQRISRERELGARLGVVGTPTFVTPEGTHVGLGGLASRMNRD